MLGLVAQTIHITIQIGVKWIARTPPKRQVEGSNPSEPALIIIKWLKIIFYITITFTVY